MAAALMRPAAQAWALLLLAGAAAGAAEGPQARKEPLSLTPSQQQAVGIRVEHPLPVSSAPEVAAYGTVLDPVALVTDLGRIESARAAAAAATAEAARLENLYRNGAQASLKALQAAQALAVESGAQAQAASLNFAQQWGPLASRSPAQRHTLLEALSEGQELLLRAEVPGRRLGGAIGRRAILEVDGVNVAATVLGPLPRIDAQSQSAAWLLQVTPAPQGLGPGARVAVRLQAAAEVKGVLLPATALVYSEEAVYVYRQLDAGGGPTLHYAEVTVKPLARVGGGWVVEGVGPADEIVVQGAGVLWSLRGISSFSAAEAEHD